MRTKFRLLVMLALVASGCGIVNSGTLEKPVARKDNSLRATAVDRQTPNAGFDLEIGKGFVSLQAQKFPLKLVLEHLAERLSFELRYHLPGSPLVDVHLSEQPLSQLFGSVIQGISYHATYAAEVNDQGFRVTALTVGTSPMRASTDDRLLGSNPDQLASDELTPEDVFIGSDPFELDLAERLLNPDPAQRAIAIRDLRATPNEFSIAEKMFRRDPDPAVAIAVLQLAESEDVFVANQLIVDALDHPNPAPVLFALDIINRRHDYSLMPRLEKLRSHQSTRVQERAYEVLQSLGNTYPSPI